MIIQLGMFIKPVALSKMCLEQSHHRYICLHDEFYLHNGFKWENDWNRMEHISSWSMLAMLMYWVKT